MKSAFSMMLWALIVAMILGAAYPTDGWAEGAEKPKAEAGDPTAAAYTSAVEKAEKQFLESLAAAKAVRDERIRQAVAAYMPVAQRSLTAFSDARKRAIAAAITAYDAKMSDLTKKGDLEGALEAKAAKDRFISMAQDDSKRLKDAGDLIEVPITATVSNDSASAPAPLSPSPRADMRKIGLIGRVNVGKDDPGIAFLNKSGTVIRHRYLQESLFKLGYGMTGVTITLHGHVDIPRDMDVLVWHVGGSSSGGVTWLYIDDKELGSVGDDRTKEKLYRVFLTKGSHTMRWVLKGGDIGANVIQCFTASDRRPIPVYFTGEDEQRARAEPFRVLLEDSSTENLPTISSWEPHN